MIHDSDCDSHKTGRSDDCYCKDDQWYIRRGVELADGWTINETYPDSFVCPGIGTFGFKHTHQPIVDALAAQLVRQVDALGFEVVIWSDLTRIRRKGDAYLEYMEPQRDDRTMNTIRAIVDSGVLG